jgi:hypothetical protein
MEFEAEKMKCEYMIPSWIQPQVTNVNAEQVDSTCLMGIFLFAWQPEAVSEFVIVYERS